jgi:ankyrin repeat protein
LHTLVNVFNKDTVEAGKIMQLLIDAGADVNAKNKEGWTPLHCAIKKASLPAIVSLVNTHKIDLSKPGNDRQTPLHLAAQSNSFEILQIFLDLKPDLFTLDDQERRPFNAVNNNLLLMKLIKKEERKYFHNLHASEQPRMAHLEQGKY